LHGAGLFGLFGFGTILTLFITGIIYIKPKSARTLKEATIAS